VQSLKNIYKCRKCGEFVEVSKHCGEDAILILDSKRRTALSKLMSFILRHDPTSIGLKLDKDGWARISDLVEGIKTKWKNAHLYKWITEEHIYAIALLDPKGRFEIRNGFIRARYGHNKALNVHIKYEEDQESRVLFHGTAREILNTILKEGIKPMKRIYVHLTTEVKEACEVGKRHSRNPIVLVIDAQCLRDRGLQIYRASHIIRIVKYIPPRCIVDTIPCKP